MFNFAKIFFSMALLAMFVWVTPLVAQETGDDDSGSSDYGYDAEETDGDTTGQSPTTQITTITQVAPRLASVSALCAASGGYLADCMAERIEALTKDASKMGGYDEMQQILKETAEELRLLVRENQDPSRPRARLVAADGQSSSRPLVAVAPDRIESTHAQAIRILEEAETRLLRSATGSTERANQYRQVAEALGSNKVLLRS